MIGVNLRQLLEKCNTFCTQALYDAAALAVGRTHHEVSVEHFLLKCLENVDSDIPLLLDKYGIDRNETMRAITRALDDFRTGNSARPGFSMLLVDLLEAAWLISSVDLKQPLIRSGAVALAYAKRPSYYAEGKNTPALTPLKQDEATSGFMGFVDASLENAVSVAEGAAGEQTRAVAGAQGFISQFCEDFTAKARAGKIDTVFGRDAEIRNVLTILARRRKNNPILVGEPGVGKTAVIEGLAKRIIEGDCPPSLHGVTLLSLDMGLLEAGASIKGEFERRLKGVIDEIKGSATPIILFIDEAHMLIGAGGQAGGSDAANLLKPALARGELRTCAATTWKEYKKYFEKDPALARRFQLVSLDEPSKETAVLILRGLRALYEKAHKVVVQDDAITSSVDFSHRFISGRFLPDKAIDLLDTACAKVKMSLSVKPSPLEDAERGVQALKRELDALERDAATGGPEHTERMEALQTQIADLENAIEALSARWENELATAKAFVASRDAYGQAVEAHKAAKAKKIACETAPSAEAKAGEADDAKAPEADAGKTPAEPATATGTPALATDASPSGEAAMDTEVQLALCRQAMDEARAAHEAARGDNPLLSVTVSPDVVAQVISDWTGIPVGKVAREEASLIADMFNHLAVRIKGQDAALESVTKVIKASKAGLRAPGTPVGVFLLVGPSGVGKTETGLALADLLFGDEESAITINMSEFQERHTVSRLIGSPPGYVGYGEGGLLTEAVRRKPYSVLILDEVEKAHPDVMNLFYQVFDKGDLTDGEGKKVNFGSTVIMLTSNLGTDTLHEAGRQGITDSDTLKDMIHQELAGHFKPALLARMTVVPFTTLSTETLARIARMKLNSLGSRLKNNNGLEFLYSDAVITTIVERCHEVDTGARNIDHILAASVLPQLAQTLLLQMSDDSSSVSSVNIDLGDDGAFTIAFS